MRIAVLADTHVDRLEYLPRKVVDALTTVDLIIHAGDFTDIQLLRELKRLGEVKAVHDNMDSRELKAELPIKEIVETKDKRIGVTHGSGAPWGIEERTRKTFESDRIDIVYGHSHRFQNKVINDTLFQSRQGHKFLWYSHYRRRSQRRDTQLSMMTVYRLITIEP